MKSTTIILYSLLVFTGVFITGRFLDNGRMMIPEFTVPYFSGQALLQPGQEWQFNLNEVDTLRALQSIPDKNLSREKINAYHFSSDKINVRSYSINQPGYLYIAFVARKIFMWMGDIGAVKCLQLFVHAMVSLMVILLLKNNADRLLFFIFYAVNPFLIYYAVYPFYYFWEMLPSAFFVYFYLSRKRFPLSVLLLLALLLAFLFQVRSTVFVIAVMTLIIASAHLPWFKISTVLLLFFLALWVMQPNSISKHPGHVTYTSLGAYPNKYVRDFNDTISWNAYRKYKGVDYNYTSTPGMFDATIFFGESEWCLTEYKKIALNDPLMILRNASLNFFQSFSIGYFQSSLRLSYLSAILGLLFFIILLIQLKYKLLIAIVAASCTFIPYLAPLPVYLYGSYLLLTVALIEILNGVKPWKKMQEKFG